MRCRCHPRLGNAEEGDLAELRICNTIFASFAKNLQFALVLDFDVCFLELSCDVFPICRRHLSCFEEFDPDVS